MRSKTISGLRLTSPRESGASIAQWASCSSAISRFAATDVAPRLTLRQVNRTALSRNVMRALKAQPDIPPLSAYPRSHQVRALVPVRFRTVDMFDARQVTYRYYLGMISFLNEEYAQARARWTCARRTTSVEPHRPKKSCLSRSTTATAARHRTSSASLSIPERLPIHV